MEKSTVFSPFLTCILFESIYHTLVHSGTLWLCMFPLLCSRRYIAVPDKAVFDDIDPEYGLHGYQLHIDMHSQGNRYMCSTFRSLFCRKGTFDHIDYYNVPIYFQAMQNISSFSRPQ